MRTALFALVFAVAIALVFASALLATDQRSSGLICMDQHTTDGACHRLVRGTL
jgi:hypothetical protein